MSSLTFQRQIVLGVVLIVSGNLLAFAFRNGIFSNIMWILNYSKPGLSRTK